MSYFKPLRRKLGLFTLLVACVLMVGWLRSSVCFDALCVPRSPIAFGSFEQSLLFGIFTSSTEEHPFWDTSALADQSFFTMPQIEWKVLWKGFGIGRSTGQIVTVVAGVPVGTPDYDFAVVPYWSIVVPLSVLATWLLLSKPRRRNGLPNAEDVP